MSQELATRSPSNGTAITLAEMRLMAEAVVRGGLFGHLRTPESVLTLMLLAQAEGIHPMTAVRRYHVIQGTPAMKAEAVLADFMARGGKVEWLAMSDQECRARWHAPGVVNPLEIAWTMAMAKAAGLTGKDNWKGYPRAMLRARCITEGVRSTMPGVLAGLPTVEEAEDYGQAIPAAVMDTQAPEVPAPAAEPPTLDRAIAAFNAATTVEELKKVSTAAKGLTGADRDAAATAYIDRMKLLRDAAATAPAAADQEAPEAQGTLS